LDTKTSLASLPSCSKLHFVVEFTGFKTPPKNVYAVISPYFTSCLNLRLVAKRTNCYKSFKEPLSGFYLILDKSSSPEDILPNSLYSIINSAPEETIKHQKNLACVELQQYSRI
jgi:hypothetical protein